MKFSLPVDTMKNNSQTAFIKNQTMKILNKLPTPSKGIFSANGIAKLKWVRKFYMIDSDATLTDISLPSKNLVHP
jgi:hypothetical protein